MRVFHILVLGAVIALFALGVWAAGSRARNVAVGVVCVSAALGLLALYQFVAATRAS